MATTRTLLAGLAVTALAAVPAVPTVAPDALLTPSPALVADACVDLADVAASVTDVAGAATHRTTVLGTDVVVVVDPMITPGIPTPRLAVGDLACEVDAFNLVGGALGDAGTVAGRFASIAAMQWLGDVTVRDTAVAGDTVTLQTVGGRHGVVSDWTVTVDALGVRGATFETTAFGVGLAGDLHVEDLEGVTSLPGHTRTWTRDAAGLLRIDASLADDIAASFAEREAAAHRAARMVGLGPGDFLEHSFDDGLTIRLSYGVAATPVETVRSGAAHADRLMTLHDGIKSLYDDFMSWGVVDPFDNRTRSYFGFSTQLPDEAGYVNIDSGLSAYCLACAFLTDGIEIHMAFVFPDVAPEVVGASYPDREQFFVDVLGHELVHSLQGGYGNGGGASALTNGFVEASARASEALFDFSANTFQPDSIAYLDNGNGCEGFDNGRGGWTAAQAAGPWVGGHTYDSCYFYWSYYAEHGPEGLVALLEALPAALADRNGQSAPSLNLELLDLASSTGDGTVDLARWAAAYTAGNEADGYTITGANGTPQNWFQFLRPAARSTELAGSGVDATVSNGGTRGFRVTRDGVLGALPDGAEAFVFEVVDGELELVGPVAVGGAVRDGQLLSVVAPEAGTAGGQVRID